MMNALQVKIFMQNFALPIFKHSIFNLNKIHFIVYKKEIKLWQK